nr:phosphoenolpyruvate synthase [Candidatus Levybacteria bacterium]
MAYSAHHIAWFLEIRKEDVALVGGKGANLGEMTSAGFPVPPGFIITSNAYYDFIRENNLTIKIKHLLSTTNFEDSKSLEQVSLHIKKLIKNGTLSNQLIKDIVSSYNKLSGPFSHALVAVRSSATAEDLANASFAGQQETFLNVKGDAVLLEKIKEGWASLYDGRAIYYRHQQKYDDIKIGIALVVQKMVESDKSGIMFTIDPVTNDKSKITIEAIYGLGELIVQGAVTPDHYEVDKKELKVLSKKTSIQDRSLIKKGVNNKGIKLSKKQGSKQKLSEKEILSLAKLGKEIEKHYYFPQDLEWAIEKNNIYIVQTRSVTTTKNVTKANNTVLKESDLILKGDPASPGIASGPVRVIFSPKEIDKVLSGDILVAPQTNPDFVPAMKKAVAIVTDSGGRTSHAAIVSRELGIPAVVGTEFATKQLKTGNIITVNGTNGQIYKGGFLTNNNAHIEAVSDIKTVTKLYVNLAEPDLADKISQKNPDGIGLLRAEFIMADIGVHPKKMIHDGKKHIYIDKLANDIAKFCKAFDQKPVVYRTSDFKTNEYRNLVGGKDYEPQESNPMLGFRGAFRYIHDPEVFKLELEAIKNVRNKMGYKNLWIMIPFVRTVEELIKVKKLINDSRLSRSSTFKIWMMVEIPSNVILLEKFIEVGIDGISIGSNDLTMLTMGTDRDNSEVASEFNEMDQSTLWAFEHIIKTAHKFGITSSMCGQAVSTYPELVRKLVEWGTTSVSVSPDAIESTRKLLSQTEKEILNK